MMREFAPHAREARDRAVEWSTLRTAAMTVCDGRATNASVRPRPMPRLPPLMSTMVFAVVMAGESAEFAPSGVSTTVRRTFQVGIKRVIEISLDVDLERYREKSSSNNGGIFVPWSAC